MSASPEAVYGALPTAGGTWFCVEAPNASVVELCLFESGGADETRRLPLVREPSGVHRLFVPGVMPGQEYGYRVSGPVLGGHGRYFNPNKLLIDPWARRLTGPLQFHESQRTRTATGGPDLVDSVVAMLRSVVQEARDVAPHSERPRVPLANTILYECHVRGMTLRHPKVPHALRGTFLGLCHHSIIEHLELLSVTTVSLMPVAACFVEEHLVAKGVTNYWGYAPIAPFAPDPHLATPGGDAVEEFRQMVRVFHAAGLEVLVDVVFNHTAEGDDNGVTLSLRGLDHEAFYAVSAEQPCVPLDYTGCGNSLDVSSPPCLRYVMDALRYWATEMEVDGFRFDLATTLARTPLGFDLHGPFLSAVAQDPVLRNLKLIAEPWDLGMGGYRLGGFPPEFAEWNDRYRDGVRRFFRGDGAMAAELATRLSGSSDLFGDHRRGPQASVNFVTSHDGFTLMDLVSYERRHNEINGENGADGHSENFSQNCGVEGETERVDVQQARLTTARSVLLCLAMSHGVPMLSHGDELGRSQRGNNNAYCQDNELTHVDWSSPLLTSLLPFASAAFAARVRHPCLRPDRHMHGAVVDGRADLSWWHPSGKAMGPGDWGRANFAMRLCGKLGDSVLVLFNSGSTPCSFVFPKADPQHAWSLVVDGADAQPRAGESLKAWTVAPRAAALLEQRRIS